jgi:hypothetical protein
MIVVVDTNVFVRESHLFRKKAGPPLIHFLRGAGGKILVPEILEREYEEQALAAVLEEVKGVHAAFGKIQTLVGARDDYRVPTAEMVIAATKARLQEMGALILRVALSDEIIVAGCRRSIGKKPPTSKTDHGLKDCLIWESVMRLPPPAEVRLVSHDKAFFADGKLHPELAEEAQQKGLNVRAMNSLEEVLDELQGVPVFDADLVLEKLHEGLQPAYAKALAHWSLTSLGGGAWETLFEPYATEHASRLYITFEQTIDGAGATVNATAYPNVKLRLGGSFDWDVDAHVMRNLQVDTEAVLTSDRAMLDERKSYFMSAHGVLFGRRQVRFTERRKLLQG